MNFRKIFTRHTVAVLAIVFSTASASSALAGDDTTIVSHIENQSEGKVKINQPESLSERLLPSNGNPDNASQPATTSQAGYRVQVFSDGNQSTAKNQAQSRERQIKARFPDLECYLSYKAPTWRLRVGDFRTRSDATELLEELREAFPSFAREMIVVTDKIDTSAL